jgi:hypothetical protein
MEEWNSELKSKQLSSKNVNQQETNMIADERKEHDSQEYRGPRSNHVPTTATAATEYS